MRFSNLKYQEFFIDSFLFIFIFQDIRIGNIGLAGYGLNDEDRRKVQRFDTIFDDSSKQLDHFNDTIGFFVAKFIKEKTIDS